MWIAGHIGFANHELKPTTRPDSRENRFVPGSGRGTEGFRQNWT